MEIADTIMTKNKHCLRGIDRLFQKVQTVYSMELDSPGCTKWKAKNHSKPNPEGRICFGRRRGVSRHRLERQ